jgi:hypothetical protein
LLVWGWEVGVCVELPPVAIVVWAIGHMECKMARQGRCVIGDTLPGLLAGCLCVAGALCPPSRERQQKALAVVYDGAFDVVEGHIATDEWGEMHVEQH